MAHAPVAGLPDTAFLAACFRARESTRPDAIIRDPFARLLSGSRGAAALSQLPGDAAGFGCVVRTWLVDELLLHLVRSHDIDTVLNLGAGLDTRPFRLDLPPQLTWIEVDDQEILDYKQQQLRHAAPHCRVVRCPGRITTGSRLSEWFGGKPASAGRCLVLTEGLLIYLEDATVSHLAQELCTHPGVAGWIADIASPLTLLLMEHAASRLPGHSGPRWIFAPAEGAGYFAIRGWRIIVNESCVDAGYRLQRPLYPETMLLQLPEPQQRQMRQLTHVALLAPVSAAAAAEDLPEPASKRFEFRYLNPSARSSHGHARTESSCFASTAFHPAS